MINWEQIAADISRVIRANGIKAITGDLLQEVLLDMLSGSETADADAIARDAELRKLIDAGGVDFAALAERVAAIEKQQPQQDAAIKDNQKEIATLKNAQPAVLDRLNKLEQAGRQTEAEIGKINDKDKAQDGRLETLEKKQGETTRTLQEIAKTDARQDQQLEALGTADAKQIKAIQDLQKKEKEQDARLTEAEQKADQQQQEIEQGKQKDLAQDAEIKQVKDHNREQDKEIQDRPTYKYVNDKNAIQDAKIEALVGGSDVVGVVASKQELDAYDVTGLEVNKDVVKVLRDETRGNQVTYYRLTSKNPTTWTFVGALGLVYTQAEVDAMIADVINNYTYNDITFGVGYKDGSPEEGIKIDLIETPDASYWQIVFPASVINFYRTRGNGKDRLIGRCTQFEKASEKDRTFKFISLKILVLNTTSWTFSLKQYNDILAKDEIYAFGAREHSKTICPFGVLVPTLFYNFISYGPAGGYFRLLAEANGAVWHPESTAKDGTQGAYWLNGFEDIGVAEMSDMISHGKATIIPIRTSTVTGVVSFPVLSRKTSIRTNLPNLLYSVKLIDFGSVNIEKLFYDNNKFEVLNLFGEDAEIRVGAFNIAFYFALTLKKVLGVFNCDEVTEFQTNLFSYVPNFEEIRLKNIKTNIRMLSPKFYIGEDEKRGGLGYWLTNTERSAGGFTITLAKALEGTIPAKWLTLAQEKNITIAFA